MPLLSPTQIRSVLKETKTDEKDLKSLLNDNGLSPEDCISELGSAIRCADSSAMKFRGLETALKLNGLLQSDTGVQIPVVNIIINDSNFATNPILIPRS